MNLTNEEKEVIADKMWWRFKIVNFDLNDASLVVDELMQQGIAYCCFVPPVTFFSMASSLCSLICFAVRSDSTSLL